MCHGGSDLPPDWLGSSYYCDSGLRGGRDCAAAGAFEQAGCRDEAACVAAGCDTFFSSGLWYEADEAAPIFDNTSEGFLCIGPRSSDCLGPIPSSRMPTSPDSFPSRATAPSMAGTPPPPILRTDLSEASCTRCRTVRCKSSNQRMPHLQLSLARYRCPLTLRAVAMLQAAGHPIPSRRASWRDRVPVRLTRRPASF